MLMITLINVFLTKKQPPEHNCQYLKNKKVNINFNTWMKFPFINRQPSKQSIETLVWKTSPQENARGLGEKVVVPPRFLGAWNKQIKRTLQNNVSDATFILIRKDTISALLSFTLVIVLATSYGRMENAIIKQY